MKGHIMKYKKPLFILFLIAVMFAVVLFYIGSQRNYASQSQSHSDRTHMDREKDQLKQLSQSYGKPKLPVEVSIHLDQNHNSTAPIKMLISAISQIPLDSVVLTLKVPQIGIDPESTEFLCSATTSDYFVKDVEYVIDILPVGKYRFIAVFEFTTDNNNTRKQALSKSLYLDVRPAKILSSNISFNHIKRVELWQELEQRALASIRSESESRHLRMRSLDIANIKASHPNLMRQKIQEIKANDPDIARRIKELNRVKVETIEAPKI
jgi:hypothetical protein